MTFERDIPWIRLNGVSSEALGEARRQTHNAVQWLARFSRSYLPPSPDDSHTSLTWNHISNSLDTDAVVIGDKKMNLCFDFASLSIKAVTENGVLLDQIDLHGRSDMDVEQEFVASLERLGFDTDNFQTDLPYSLGNATFTDEDRYDRGIIAQGLPELARYFVMLTAFSNILYRCGPTPVRCVVGPIILILRH